MTWAYLARPVLVCLLALVASWAPWPVSAHPLAPSLLSVEASGGHRFEVQWKTPLQRVPGSKLQPVLPQSCGKASAAVSVVQGTGLVTRWTVDCGTDDLAGKTIAVSGIASSKADVLLRLKPLHGPPLQQVLTESQARYVVPARQTTLQVFFQYMGLGVHHLLTGIDHVLFIISLTLLVGLRRPLIWTITSFTLGHSVTLSLAALGHIHFSQPIAEALIAFSIVFTVGEVMREDPRSWLRRFPWVLGFCFGLLHGLGFANALAEVGLPASDIPLALFSFNVGIEIGQLTLIVPLLLGMLALRRLPAVDLPAWRWAPAYAVGTLAGFWFWQRLLVLWL